MESRKNTILLTVIAVATLLVAVVGATFAFFGAQGGDAVEKKVEVTTHTTDSATFSISDNISILATQQNFGKDSEQLAPSVVTGKATFTAGDNADNTNAKLCYTATLSLTGNMPKANASDPDVAKGNTFKYPTAAEQTKYVAPYLTDGKTYGTLTAPEKAELVFTVKKTRTTAGTTGTEETLVSSKDITELTSDFVIPTSSTSGASTIFEMQPAAGKTITDDWTFSVQLINKTWDQQYNTNKEFKATLEFKKVDCA